MPGLTIYIAASVRHIHGVRILHRVLREHLRDVQILDWTEHAVPPPGITAQERRQWYDTDAAGTIYSFCRDACQHADIVVYYGASGQDAGVEVGIASAAGVPIIGLRGPLESPGLMLHGAVSHWVNSADDLLALLQRIHDCSGIKKLTTCELAHICPCGNAMCECAV